MLGYIGYSLVLRVFQSDPPTAAETTVVVFASVLPDLIDKPLAWQFGVFETGWGPSHSVFVAVPASVLALAVGWRLGTRSGTSFAFGYLLHLVGDVVPYSLGRSGLQFAPVLWPVGNPSPGEYGSFVGGVRDHAVEYAAQLAAGDITMTLVLQVGSVSLGTLLWLADGLPGLRLAVVSARRTVIELIPE